MFGGFYVGIGEGEERNFSKLFTLLVVNREGLYWAGR